MTGKSKAHNEADRILFGIEKEKQNVLPWQSTMVDYSDNIGGTKSHRSDNVQKPYKNRHSSDGHVIHFVHMPTSDTCHFKAFLTQYEDQYASQWNETEVFGRMDPISTFSRTRRKILLGWDVPAASEEEAILNLYESERLLSMLYPVYEERNLGISSFNEIKAATDRDLDVAAEQLANGNISPEQANNIERNIQEMLASAEELRKSGRTVNTMVAPPLFKVKFSNLIMDSNSSGYNADAAKAGLVCTISGLTYAPDIESGFFGGGPDSFVSDGALVPQTIKFSCELTIHHTHGLGYLRKNKPHKRVDSFPHRGKGGK